VSIPRGFALVLEDLERGGWDWSGFSHRTAPDPDDEDDQQHTHTIVSGRHAGRDGALWLHWMDGRWASGWSRRWSDPVAVAIGSRAVRPIASGQQPLPAWTRPDLNAPRRPGGPPRWDEGGPAADRARINARRIAGGFDPLPEVEAICP
jgi:hypothetical protein